MLYSRKKEIYEVSEFLILALVLKSKVGKVGHFSRLLIVLLKEVENFRGFRVFNFDPYTEINNSENSGSFSRSLNLNEFLLFEEI